MLKTIQNNKIFFMSISVLFILIILYVYSLSKQNQKIVSQTGMTSTSRKDPLNQQVKILNIYASWCGWSQKLLPEWTQVEDYFKGNKNIIVEKHEESENPNIVKNYNVTGYPSIFKIDKKGQISEYPDNLPRTAEHIIKWAKE